MKHVFRVPTSIAILQLLLLLLLQQELLLLVNPTLARGKVFQVPHQGLTCLDPCPWKHRWSADPSG